MAHLAVLAKIRGLSAIGAATVAEARALIQEAAPQVVVLDMRLPDGTGLDVIAALEATKTNAVVIVASAYLDDYRGMLPHSERVHLLGKPVPMHELRRIVEELMTNTNVLGPFTVLDYVQLACMGRHSAIIECSGSAGRGEIIIERGELWSAADPAGSGLPAFERLLLASKATAKALSGQRPRGPRNLSERWELLILDALRVQDEQGNKAAVAARQDANHPTAQAAPPSAATHRAPSSAQVSPAKPAAAPPQTTASAAAKPLPVAPSSPLPSAASSPASSGTTTAAKGPAPAPTEARSAPVVTLPSDVAARSAQAPTLELVRPEPAKPTVAARVEPAPAPARSEPVPAPARSEPAPDPQARSPRRDDGFDACIERALRAVVAKNFALAIAELEQAQSLRPGDPMVIHRLARLRSLQP